ncbi:MAG: transglutaminase family protein [Bacteroidota bacterium]|nr:transglutaminase family protein [Bacteroidota bacterium]
MPIFKIYHSTKYEYDGLAKESVNEIKIYPFHTEDQQVLQHELTITGDPEVHTYIDYWRNKTGTFNLLPPHKELVIESRLTVRTNLPSEAPMHFENDFEDLADDVNDQLQMLELATPDPIALQSEIHRIINAIHQKGKSVAATIADCCKYIYENFNYSKGITDVETTVDEILEHRGGVCQDFAHVLLQILRTLKIPSKYVSGYICPNKNGMRGEGATHAWVEAWIPKYGWAGIDPTNNVWVTDKHVKLALGRHFHDCSPIKGTFKGGVDQKLSVFVSVGYEDGYTFEEINNVPIGVAGTISEPVLKKAGAVQQ